NRKDRMSCPITTQRARCHHQIEIMRAGCAARVRQRYGEGKLRLVAAANPGRETVTKQIPNATNRFASIEQTSRNLWPVGNRQRDAEPATSRSGRNRGRQMLNLNAFARHSRRTAALAAFAIGAIAFSCPAAAAPQAPLFPFFLLP